LDEEINKNKSSNIIPIKSDTFSEEREYIKKMLRNNLGK
jgi:hypothetical protein